MTWYAGRRGCWVMIEFIRDGRCTRLPVVALLGVSLNVYNSLYRV